VSLRAECAQGHCSPTAKAHGSTPAKKFRKDPSPLFGSQEFLQTLNLFARQPRLLIDIQASAKLRCTPPPSQFHNNLTTAKPVGPVRSQASPPTFRCTLHGGLEMNPRSRFLTLLDVGEPVRCCAVSLRYAVIFLCSCRCKMSWPKPRTGKWRPGRYSLRWRTAGLKGIRVSSPSIYTSYIQVILRRLQERMRSAHFEHYLLRFLSLPYL
jgi:hypothetical protein